MKNLHKIQPDIPDKLWAGAYWFCIPFYDEPTTRVKMVGPHIARNPPGPLDTIQEDGWSIMSHWKQSAWAVVLNNWKRAGSPKTQELRDRMVL